MQDDVIVNTNPGTGKSCLQMAIAAQYSTGVTVMFVPIKSLALDTVESCKRKNIGCLHYTNKQEHVSAPLWELDNTIRVMVVVYDTGVTSQFQQVMWGLHQRNWLNRVVFDEAHTVVVYSDYRGE